MRRRDLLKGTGATLLTQFPAHAETGSILRVGNVSIVPRSTPFWVAFEKRMAELGYQQGKNFKFDIVRVPNLDAVPDAYQGLAARKANIFVASGPEIGLRSAVAASTTIPVVMVAIDFDPIALGYVKSLARPGGRVTGLSMQQLELTHKRLQFVKEAFPGVKAMTVFWDKIAADQWEVAQNAASNFGLHLQGIELRDPPFDYDGALSLASPEARQHLFVLSSPFFISDRVRLTAFALRNRIASVFPFREYVDAGGLLSYGPSFTGIYRRAADYVDRIARGTRVDELPIEQPTTFEMVINLRTAKALELDILPSILARADEVIE